MITHGRVHLLEEALYSFLHQDYSGTKELIIVNDYPLQTLIFDHPEVKIYNLKETFKTIGEKENFAIERCSGELIAVWDDDDIALSNHLNNINKFWAENTNILHWKRGVFYNHPEITSIGWLGNSGIVYSKKVWQEIGKSPIENAGGDTTLVSRIYSLGEEKVVFADPPDNEVSWWYRWALPVPTYHQSGMGTDTPDRLDVVQRNSMFIEEQRIKGLIPTGEIKLIPKWNENYQKLLTNYIEKNGTPRTE